MNKVLLYLLKQSTVTKYHGMGEIDELDQKRFAELIVRECMEQVWYTREDIINGNVSDVIKERIAFHFGITR